MNADGDDQVRHDLSFKAEELEAQRAALTGRNIALAGITMLVTVLPPWPGPLFYYPLIALFVVLGIAAYRVALAPWCRTWHRYAFVTADFALLSFTLIYPNPLIATDLPPQISLYFGNFVYFFTLLAGLAYQYRPGLVLWGGVSAALSWIIGILWLLSLPGATWRVPEGDRSEVLLAAMADPYYIDLGIRFQEVALLLIVSVLLALAVSRARAIALRQAAIASERTNLARYFPRKTVDLLARKTSPLSEPREHRAAVLFADIVAFTSWAERRSPRETISLLREVHGMLAETVFRHDGTLDKFIGDGLMATFGTPEPGERDAVNALSAAVDMVAAFETWRRLQAEGQGRDLQMAVGAHYGPIVLGDVGSHSRMEFAVLGDTVNVASRLEHANRAIGSRCVVSTDLVDAARAEDPAETARLVAVLREHGPLSLRGHTQATPVLVLP